MARPKKEVTRENIEKFQKELELAGNRTDILLKDKKGRSRSCLLCRRRKQRCDHKLPSCTACLKAGVKCIQPARYLFAKNNNISSSKDGSRKRYEGANRETSTADVTADSSMSVYPETSASALPQKTVSSSTSHGDTSGMVSTDSPFNLPNSRDIPRYIETLEKRLRFLEDILYSNADEMTVKQKIGQYKKMSIHTAINEGSGDPNRILPSDRQLALDKMPTAPERRDTSQRMQGKVPVRIFPSAAPSSPPPYSDCIFAEYDIKRLLTEDYIVEFNVEEIQNSLEIFLTKLQPAFYFVDEDSARKFQNNYINNHLSSYSEIKFHFSCARMWLIQAIVARFYHTTGQHYDETPERYFSTAIREVIYCTDKLDGRQTLELKALLLTYLLGTGCDFDTLYAIIGDTVDLYNKISHPPAKNHDFKDRNFNWDPKEGGTESRSSNEMLLQLGERSLFWSLYVLERTFCTVLERAFLIRESDTVLPVFHKSDSTSAHAKFRGSVYFFTELLILLRLQSTYVEKLGLMTCLSPDDNKIEGWRAKLPMLEGFFHELNHWRSECKFDGLNECERDTLRFYYFEAVRHMILPFLETLTPEHKLFKECQLAAGQICQMCRVFRKYAIVYFSPLVAHIFFTSGLTLIYSLWLTWDYEDRKLERGNKQSEGNRRKQLITAGLFSILDDLRSCSIGLYTVSERCKFAQLYRDLFDQLMDATIGHLVGRCRPDTSHLVSKLEERERACGNNGSNKSRTGGSVPRGLSHLLTEVRSDTEKDGSSEEDAEEKSTIKTSFPKNKDTDWKMFVYQALWRQYTAQQSLQKSLLELGLRKIVAGESSVIEEGNEAANSGAEREDAPLAGKQPVEETVSMGAQPPVNAIHPRGQLRGITRKMVQNLFEWISKSVNEAFSDEAEFQEARKCAKYFQFNKVD